MKVHYVVAAHRDPEQVNDLVEALHAPWTRTVVHVDKMVDQTPFATPQALARATFVPDGDRVRVRWGGWTVAKAMVVGMQTAAPDLDDDDYLVVLSGDSYPLASQEAVVTFLQANHGDQFITSVPFPDERMKKDLRRVSQYWLEADTREGVKNPIVRLVNKAGIPRDWRRAYGDYTPLCGPSWFALTGAAVHWVLAEMERNKRFVRFTEHTRNASEQFFQTMVGASPYAGRTRRHLMYLDWSRQQSFPATLDEGHVKTLRESTSLEFPHSHYGTGPVFFARKVASGPPFIGQQLREQVWPKWERLLAPAA